MGKRNTVATITASLFALLFALESKQAIRNVSFYLALLSRFDSCREPKMNGTVELHCGDDSA